MEHITVKGNKLYLNFETQMGPEGRPLRLSGIAKNLQVPEKWIDKTFKNHWVYTFIYLDKKGGFIDFEFDYFDKYVGFEKRN